MGVAQVLYIFYNTSYFPIAATSETKIALLVLPLSKNVCRRVEVDGGYSV